MEDQILRIAGISYESVVDGPGIRTTVFFQGCPHACPECHNPQTWDIGGGFEITMGELIPKLKLNPLISGVTFSGGEPFLQAIAAAECALYLKGLGLDLWVYTGYTWEYLLSNPGVTGVKKLLESADVIVDGPFLKELKTSLTFRGSSNQRFINVRSSLDSGKVVEWQPISL